MATTSSSGLDSDFSAPITAAEKLSVKCQCCATVITVATVPGFDGLEPYAVVLRRGNVVCERCFRGLSR